METEQEQVFQLLPPALPAGGQFDPNMPVSWCISRDTAKMLQDRDADDVYVLLAVEQDGREIDRFIVPLKEPMRYITFRRPGRNVVHGTLVWRRKSGHDGDPKRILTRRYDNGSYKADVVVTSQPRCEALEKQVDDLHEEQYEIYPEDSEEEAEKHAALGSQIDQLRAELDDLRGNEPAITHMRRDFDSIRRLDAEDSFEVNVPTEMFAKSWKTTTRLGTFYDRWSGGARDQCQMRRRAIFTALTIVPYFIALAVVGLVVYGLSELFHLTMIALLMLMGFRKIDYGVLKEPLGTTPKGVFKHLGASIWTHKKVIEDDREKFVERHPSFFFINPAVIIILGSGGYLIYAFFTLPLWVFIVAISAGPIVGIVVWVLMMAAAGWAENRRIARARQAEERRKAEESARQQAQLRLKRELELVACDNRPKTADYSLVPKQRRSISLRYQHTKAKVCKPFAAAR